MAGKEDVPKTLTTTKTPRKSKKDERIDKLQESVEFLTKIVTEQLKQNGKNDINITNTSDTYREEESTRKRKLPEPSEPADSPSTSKQATRPKDVIPKQKQSKVEMICEVSPADVLLTRTDRKSKEIERPKVPVIPIFDGRNGNNTLEDWLYQLESIAKTHNWDDETLIEKMKTNLDGDMLHCLTQQTKSISWEDWKRLLYNKRQSIICQEQVENLQEFVSTYRRQSEKIIDFCYSKKNQGLALGLNDTMICNVIIRRLRQPYLEEAIEKAGYRDTRSVIKYLSEHFDDEQFRDRTLLTCSNCGRRGHTTAQCFGECKYCRGTGHKSDKCFRKHKAIF